MSAEDAGRIISRTQEERDSGGAERRRSRTQEIGCSHWDIAWRGRAREIIARDLREWRNRDDETQNAGKAGRREFGVHTGTSPGEGERVTI